MAHATADSTFATPNGKQVYRYTVTDADSLRDAMDALPEEDFKIYWYNQDRRTFVLEILRHF